MTSLSNDDLRRGLRLHSSPLEGIDEREFQWNLGQITIKKKEALFRVGYWEPLRPDSRFYKVPFDFGEHRGIAAVFQTSDPGASDPDHRDYVVGWVRPEREAQLDQWLTFLNAEIGKHVASAQAEHPKAKPIRIGAFKELGFDDEPAAPSLSSVRGKRGSEHKTSVVAYLRGGRTTAYCMGLETDVFDVSKVAGSLSVRTDGTYAWPELLAYYVEHYDIALPEDFEEHMRTNGWQVPKQR